MAFLYHEIYSTIYGTIGIHPLTTQLRNISIIFYIITLVFHRNLSAIGDKAMKKIGLISVHSWFTLAS